jgi:hypothetical protein
MLFKNYRRVFKLIWETNLFCMSSIPQCLTPALTSSDQHVTREKIHRRHSGLRS